MKHYDKDEEIVLGGSETGDFYMDMLNQMVALYFFKDGSARECPSLRSYTDN